MRFACWLTGCVACLSCGCNDVSSVHFVTYIDVVVGVMSVNGHYSGTVVYLHDVAVTLHRTAKSHPACRGSVNVCTNCCAHIFSLVTPTTPRSSTCPEITCTADPRTLMPGFPLWILAEKDRTADRIDALHWGCLRKGGLRRRRWWWRWWRASRSKSEHAPMPVKIAVLQRIVLHVGIKIEALRVLRIRIGYRLGCRRPVRRGEPALRSGEVSRSEVIEANRY